MSCARFEADLVDRARGAPSIESEAALDRHLRECLRCRARFDREQALSAGLRRLSEDTVAPAADPGEEQRLLAAFDARPPHAPERTYTRSLAVAALVLAASTLVWIVPSRTHPSDPPPAAIAVVPPAASASTVRSSAGDAVEPKPQSTHTVRSGRPRPSAARRGPDDTRFVMLPGVDDLPQFESGQLMRVRLPASVVVSLGLRPPRPHDGFVQTDVLVGQDGFARAVRLVR